MTLKDQFKDRPKPAPSLWAQMKMSSQDVRGLAKQLGMQAMAVCGQFNAAIRQKLSVPASALGDTPRGTTPSVASGIPLARPASRDSARPVSRDGIRPVSRCVIEVDAACWPLCACVTPSLVAVAAGTDARQAPLVTWAAWAERGAP